MKGPAWLKTAIFYQIYPQSFYDANGDGIGDIQGIIEKLDYIKDLGCDAIWLNPIFDSPFMDAGYDVRDYYRVADRYGTNDDLVRLFETAHEKGMRILLDLVPGHTSDQHEWFKKSSQIEENEYTGRYVWTDGAFTGIKDHPYISGMTDRAGSYMLNFFASQPALNYGWLNRTEKWMSRPDSPEALATREAIKDVMRFWLEKGCDGFRVDMADSLVKNDDEEKNATRAIWRDVRAMMDEQFPDAALVSEWSDPRKAICGAGFHMDFYLDHHYNGYNTLFRDWETEGGDNSYFRLEANRDITRFLKDYLPRYEVSKDQGYISMFTCNHDTPRMSATLKPREALLGYAFMLTMPGVPFIYYGDEIGMKYLDVRTKEGGYGRTGSRTPMQWDDSANHGFSTAEKEKLYLPTDESPDAPSVKEQEDDPLSMLNVTRSLTVLRRRYEDLQADAPFTAVHAKEGDEPFIYMRGKMILVLNPSGKELIMRNSIIRDRKIVFTIGQVEKYDTRLRMGPQSFCVIEER